MDIYLKTPFPFDMQLWTKHMNAGDHLAMIIRTHLYVEFILNRRIEALLVNKRHLSVGSLKFSMKLNMAVAFGIVPDEDFPALNKLNGFRNDFAHDLNKQLTEQDERDFYNCLSIRQRRIIDGVRTPGLNFLGRLRADLGGLIMAVNETT